MLLNGQRLWIVLKSIFIGALIAIIGTLSWSLLVKANLVFYSRVPWSLIPASIFLWFFWRYLGGTWWPSATAKIRKANLRAVKLREETWSSALIAGIAGLVALLLFMSVMNKMIELPQQQLTTSDPVPVLTLFFLLLMGSVVAGVVEETAFRGYMQGGIEKQCGPVVAILLTGVMFSLAHFTHAETTWSLMPFYFGVAVVYGMMTYLTNSILPSMVLHTVGNILVGLRLLFMGQSEWQTSSKPEPLIWETGPNFSFWLSCLLFVISFYAAILAFKSLRSVAGRSKG